MNKLARLSSKNTKADRWSIATRILLASVGSVISISIIGAALSHLFHTLLGISLAQAVHTFTLLSFIVWAALVMWIFHARSLKKTVINLVVANLLFLSVYLYLVPGA